MYDGHTSAVPASLSGMTDDLYHLNSSSTSAAAILDAMLDQHAVALDSLSMEQAPFFPNAHTQDLLASVNALAPDFHEGSLNPNEEFLNNMNKDRFLSITAFFRHFVGYKDSPVGLEATPPPDVITRDHLRGDECDLQGINWAIRRTTRAAVRAKRTAFESARLSPQLNALRQVF